MESVNVLKKENTLMYYQNPYMKEFETALVDVFEQSFPVPVGPGTTKSVKCIGLVFENTIMFAEGGGQPADVGSLRIIRDTEPILNIEVDVFHVLRGADGRNIHLVTETWDFPLLELPKGTKVLQTICWERRHRHMLYHSGQHLLSAVAGETFGWATLGWQLSDNGCYVVLNTPDISTQELKALENKANEYIKDNLSVTTYLYNQGETDARLEKARTKGLPDNYGDSIRIVQIGDLENNMCCGTHVTSLSQLEMIKLLRVEKGKRNKKKEEGKEHSTLLHFMVGRKEIFEKFHDMYSTEIQLSSTLERQPCDIHDTVLEMKESQKKAKQRIKALEEENVMSLIDLFKEKKPTQEIFSLHRKDGDVDLLNFTARQFTNELKNNSVTLFLTVGEDEGNLLLAGNEKFLEHVGPLVCTIMSGRGQHRADKYRARVQMSGRKNAFKAFSEAFASFQSAADQ